MLKENGVGFKLGRIGGLREGSSGQVRVVWTWIGRHCVHGRHLLLSFWAFLYGLDLMGRVDGE